MAVVDVLRASLCLTMCPGCAASGRPPAIMLSTAERLAAQHAEHVRPVVLREVTRLHADG